MTERRWFNQHQPQTLQIAVLLLYFHGVFTLLDFFALDLGGIWVLIYLGLVAGHAYAGWGIANEKRMGYQVGIVMALAPFALRVALAGVDGLFATNILNLMFEIALVALLLHPQSSEYQKVWFK